MDVDRGLLYLHSHNPTIIHADVQIGRLKRYGALWSSSDPTLHHIVLLGDIEHAQLCELRIVSDP